MINIPFSVRQNYNKIQVTIFPPFMKRLLLYAYTLFVCPFFVRFFYFQICVYPLNSVTLSFPSLFTFMHWKLGHLHSLIFKCIPLFLFPFLFVSSSSLFSFPRAPKIFQYMPRLFILSYLSFISTPFFLRFFFLSFSPQRFCSLTIFSRLTPS